MKTLRDIGEHEAIARLVAMLPAGADVVVGPGDDCAVVRPAGGGEDLLLTSDPVVEKVHVRPDDPPEAVGHKAIARALSDIAAMGGEPRWALLNVVAPAATPVQRLEAIYRGAARTAAASLSGSSTHRHVRPPVFAYFIPAFEAAVGPPVALYRPCLNPSTASRTVPETPV